MFGQLAAYDGPIGFVFAVNVLPVVVFFSAFIAVLYHLGIMMWVVRILGGGLRRFLGTSHAESMSAAANIFEELILLLLLEQVFCFRELVHQ